MIATSNSSDAISKANIYCPYQQQLADSLRVVAFYDAACA